MPHVDSIPDLKSIAPAHILRVPGRRDTFEQHMSMNTSSLMDYAESSFRLIEVPTLRSQEPLHDVGDVDEKTPVIISNIECVQSREHRRMSHRLQRIAQAMTDKFVEVAHRLRDDDERVHSTAS
jgi:hypothetical protein